MSMVIANNMSAVNTKRQFATSARGQSGAMEKLSSGYKINTGKDDPSGLVISEKLRSQLNGLKRAQQNTEEGINVMGIAEGALNEMNSILKKMKALAIHSNNTGVTSPEQIAADQAEMDSAIQTLDRIAQTTKFSDENLLNGSKDIAYETTTATKGTQQNGLLNSRESSFNQIFKRDDYAVAISFTGTANASELTGTGEVDFSKQAMKAYLEVDTSKTPENTAQIDAGKFTQDQAFTLTGTKGSRAFTFDKGETVATMVNQIKSAADSTGIDAALVFNSDQEIDLTTGGSVGEVAYTPTDQKITFEGIEVANADPDNHDPFTMTLKADFGEYMSDNNITKAELGIGMDGADMYLSFNGQRVTKNAWNGSAADLVVELNAMGAYDDTLTDLTDALAANLTQTGAVDTASEVLQPSFEYKYNGEVSIQMDQLFTSAIPAAGTKFGKAQLDAKIDWEALRAKLVKDDAANGTNKLALFDAGIASGNMNVEFKLTGTNEADFNFQVNIYNADAGAALTDTNAAGGLLFSQAVELTNTDRQALKNGEVTLSAPGSVLAGSTITVKNMDTSTIGYQENAAVNAAAGVGGAAAIAITTPTVTGGDIVTKAKFAPAAATSGILAAGDTADNFVITDVVGADGNDMEIDVTYPAALTADDVLTGKEIKLSVELQAGEPADSPAYSIIANVGGKDYVMLKDWNGVTVKFTVAQPDLTSYNPDLTADEMEVLDALGAATWAVTLDTAIAIEDSDAFADYKTTSPATMNTGTNIIANALYHPGAVPPASATEGQVSVKFEDFDLDQWLNTSDAALLVQQLKDGVLKANVKLQAEVHNKYDSDGKATGDFEIAINVVALADVNNDGKIVAADDNKFKVYNIGTITKDDLGTLDEDGQTAGWVTIADDNARFGGMQIQITNSVKKADAGYQGLATSNLTAGKAAEVHDNGGELIQTSIASDPVTSNSVKLSVAGTTANAMAQTGGISAGADAVRSKGTVAVFNNVTAVSDPKTKETDGSIEKGVSGVTISADGAASVQLGKNTDGQGRVFVKFLDDNSFELYKDASMSQQSKVATGINGQEINEYNNSGLKGFTLDLTGSELTKVNGVYLSLAGMEGKSMNDDGVTQGVTYTGNLVGEAGKAAFSDELTYITGVELGKNTDAGGKIYMKADYNHENGTVQISAYKDSNMRAEDLVAQSDVLSTDLDGDALESMTIVLNETRNADNTAGTGLGIVLSTNSAIFKDQTKSATFTSDIEFKNLGARIFAQDYGSANYVKITQDKGSVFSYYGSAGQNTSKMMVDAGADGTTVQLNGQDATLSINGSQVRTNGLNLEMATQDIQASLVFNAGKVGSTTLAQVGYETGSIFTKIGALNLSGVDAEVGEDNKYQHLSGQMANAGHVTNETVDEFQGGMQLQLGEGAGDQNRTVVAIKSMTSENLGRVTKGGYWDTGSAVYTEKTFTMKDVFGGGVASLSQAPTLAMSIIEQAINDVSELRAQIGAVQTNMLQTNSNNLAVTMENIQKTESGIRDADMADEMTEFTKNQVLQNAAMSMMSQANQSSQNVLQLLR